ncbi:MAG TPA: glycosyltransferase [Solirubrobacteraceae bacterium]|nr:glycosyltransferase [Solirubrobacteraceae bacterium]
MSSGTPTVSVVLRTYNHAAWIAQAIESVLLQRVPFAFELIVAEDCSSDGTRAIVEGYAARHPDVIRPLLPERNVGHGEMFRRGLEAAGGRYIAYLDGDDYWTSTAKLARQVEFLEREPACPSCFHDVSLIYDDAGVPSGAVTPHLAEQRVSLEQILMECFIPAPAMLFRSEVAARLPGWVFESAWIDWLIHIRGAESGPIGYLPEVLAAYRVHRGGMFSALDRVSQLEEDVRFYPRLMAELPRERDLIERCLANRHAQLAVERLGVSFDSCVVLVDPSHQFRPYFNGRHARNLPRRAGREVTELEVIREAARDLPVAVEDYGAHTSPSARQSGCYVVVPRDAERWVAEHTQLGSYLACHGRIAYENAWVTVHALQPLAEVGMASGAGGLRRVDVSMLLDWRGDPAGFLDAPRSGELMPAHAATVAGWIVGRGGTAELIDFEIDGAIVWRAPVQRRRSDVAAAFPDLAVADCGFQTTLNAVEIPAGAVTTLLAVFADGARIALAELRFDGPGGQG